MAELNENGAAPQEGSPSPAKIEANRRNGLKSNGPSTERGKSQSKYNALKCGLTSNQVVIERIDGEGAAERFAALHDCLCEHFLVEDPVSAFRVERVAANMWRLQRHDRAEAAMAEEAILRAAQDDLLARFRFPGILSDDIPAAASITEPHSHRLRLLVDRLREFEEEIQRNGNLSAESLCDLMKLFGTYDSFAVQCAVLCVTAKAANYAVPSGRPEPLPPSTVANQIEQATRLLSEKRQQISELQPELEHLEQQQRAAHLATLGIPSPANCERLWRSRAAINKELEQDLAHLNRKPPEGRKISLSQESLCATTVDEQPPPTVPLPP